MAICHVGVPGTPLVSHHHTCTFLCLIEAKFLSRALGGCKFDEVLPNRQKNCDELLCDSYVNPSPLRTAKDSNEVPIPLFK